MHQRGPAVVRIVLFCLFFGAFALGLVQPAQAGTEAAPEIVDPANDQAIAGQVPISQQPPGGVTSIGLNADLLLGWIDNDTPTHLTLNIRIQGTGAPTSSSSTRYVFNLETGGEAYTAGANVAIANAQGGLPGSGAVTPTGAAESATVEAGHIKIVVPKANIGSPTGGAVLTNLFITASGRTADQANTITDRAPNSGAGTDYVVAGGANATAPGDSDGDGLNDTCEMTYFKDLNTTHNATGDADGDGLTNGQECVGGTDPTKADTDGDGVNDDKDPFPTDPTKGGNTSGSGSQSGSRSGSGTGSGSRSNTGGTGSNSRTSGDGSVEDFGDAVEKLKSDPGYLGISAGGFLSVLILAILALAVRWSL